MNTLFCSRNWVLLDWCLIALHNKFLLWWCQFKLCNYVATRVELLFIGIHRIAYQALDLNVYSLRIPPSSNSGYVVTHDTLLTSLFTQEKRFCVALLTMHSLNIYCLNLYRGCLGELLESWLAIELFEAQVQKLKVATKLRVENR